MFLYPSSWSGRDQKYGVGSPAFDHIGDDAGEGVMHRCYRCLETGHHAWNCPDVTREDHEGRLPAPLTRVMPYV